MESSDYSKLLKDPRWQRVRLKVMERDEWKCCACRDETKELHVHHIRYNGAPWDAAMEDMQTLCVDCHDKLGPHPKGGVYWGNGPHGLTTILACHCPACASKRLKESNCQVICNECGLRICVIEANAEDAEFRSLVECAFALEYGAQLKAIAECEKKPRDHYATRAQVIINDLRRERNGLLTDIMTAECFNDEKSRKLRNIAARKALEDYGVIRASAAIMSYLVGWYEGVRATHKDRDEWESKRLIASAKHWPEWCI